MSAERLLRDTVRRILRTGRLPDRGPDTIRGGLGSGAACVICEACIGSGDIELEIRFTRGEYRARHLVHLHCYSIYEDERQTARHLRALPAPPGHEGAA